jgi:hypothetical protein
LFEILGEKRPPSESEKATADQPPETNCFVCIVSRLTKRNTFVVVVVSSSN